MVYSWKVPVYKVSAQQAGEHIEELDRIHGEVTPQILLDDSRPTDAVLHPCYEWDDSIAAEKYRLHQSKKIIGNLVIVSVSKNKDDAEKETRVNAFVSIKERNESASYRPTVMALSNSNMKAQVVKNAVAELRMFKAKYNGIVDFESIIKEVFQQNKINPD